jgi:exosortase/archaeosortase family protein
MTQVLATSRVGHWSLRLENVPPAAWLALHAAAFWPHWRWVAARLADGSDDPLGLAALLMLAWCVLRLVPDLRAHPRAGWWVAAAVLSLAATASLFVARSLVGSLLAASALACSVAAFAPSGRAIAPMAGLAVLALPVVSSLQFYAGYPLRVVTAEASTWLLTLSGMNAVRSGAAMEVDGQLVIVDAPCSGVQMAWFGYFSACAVAAWLGVSDRSFLRRVPFIGMVVLAGNVVRNTTLVALEASGHAPSEAMHQGIGLVVLTVVCLVVIAIVRGGRDAST